jgi:protein phosphatase PTC7
LLFARAIQEAYRRVAASKIKGGCTALVAILEKDQRLLRIANLGDSGLLVLRENLKKTSMDVVFRTKEQQHYFNCPFQLGYPEGDSALEASTSEIEIEEGDILIAATDGVLDNMFDQEIAEITLAELQRFHQQSSHDTEHSWIQRLAVMIASEALRNAFDPSRTSPFQKNAQLSGYRSFTGGKVDDITVISARISE